jgi:hypothetical protein
VALNPFDAIVYCKEPPEFELREGWVHVTQRIGKQSQTERIMSRNTFLKSYKAAGKLVEQITSERSVVRFKRENGTH